jgi:peptidoglycan/LPS O-acetylase OafA/YrhL
LTLLYISCGAFLILVMEYSRKLTELWIYRMIAQIGLYSYGIYLWHSLPLGLGELILARYSGWPAWFLALSVQFTIAVAIGYVTTRLIEWPVLYYRESIPWLRDSKPLLAANEDPGPSHSDHPHKGSIATPSVESSGKKPRTTMTGV